MAATTGVQSRTKFYERALSLARGYRLLTKTELEFKLGKIEALLENPFEVERGGLSAEEARLLRAVVFEGGVKAAIQGKNGNTARNVLASARRKLGLSSSSEAAGMVLRTIEDVLRS